HPQLLPQHARSPRPMTRGFVTPVATPVRRMSRLITETRKTAEFRGFLVDLGGLEPPTPCMPCRCATSCATDPGAAPDVLGATPLLYMTPASVVTSRGRCGCPQALLGGSTIMNMAPNCSPTMRNCPQRTPSASRWSSPIQSQAKIAG